MLGNSRMRSRLGSMELEEPRGRGRWARLRGRALGEGGAKLIIIIMSHICKIKIYRSLFRGV